MQQTKDDQKQQKQKKYPKHETHPNVIENRPSFHHVTVHKHIRKCLMHFNIIPGIIGRYRFYTQENLSLHETNLIKTPTALLQLLLRDQIFHQELNQNNGIFCQHHSYGKQTFTFLRFINYISNTISMHFFT